MAIFANLADSRLVMATDGSTQVPQDGSTISKIYTHGPASTDPVKSVWISNSCGRIFIFKLDTPVPDDTFGQDMECWVGQIHEHYETTIGNNFSSCEWGILSDGVFQVNMSPAAQAKIMQQWEA